MTDPITTFATQTFEKDRQSLFIVKVYPLASPKLAVRARSLIMADFYLSLVLYSLVAFIIIAVAKFITSFTAITIATSHSIVAVAFKMMSGVLPKFITKWNPVTYLNPFEDFRSSRLNSPSYDFSSEGFSGFSPSDVFPNC